MAFTSRNTANATIANSMTVLTNTPYLIATPGSAPLAARSTIALSEKSTPPSSMPSGGIMTSFTSDVVILPNAAPMMTPTAMSTTLPRIAKSLNSLSMPTAILLRAECAQRSS